MFATNYKKFYDFGDSAFAGFSISPAQYDTIYDAVYGSDEFRMYAYKIRQCNRTRSHDWTECPFAHRGEKATRRDPRKFPYSAVSCPAYRAGNCLKGGACELAHGVFEYWLHPARYRTRACNAGRFCQRKVCFFAHSPEQLRSEKKYACNFIYRPRIISSAVDFDAPPWSPAVGSPVSLVASSSADSELSGNFEKLKIGGGKSENIGEIEGPEMFAQFDWIEELVK